MQQPTLWNGEVPGTDDAMVEKWLHAHRAVTGKGRKHTRNFRTAAHTGLSVCEATAASLAMDASKDCLLALVVIVGLQALASAAVMLAASVLVLAAVHSILRHMEAL